MADNVAFQSTTPATPASGEVIAAQDVGGVKYQEIIIHGLTGDATYKGIRIDATTHAIETIDYEHHEIHSGSHYFVKGYQDLAVDEVLDFTWLMPDTTKWIHWTWKLLVESETLYQVYEGATATNPLANAVTPLNSDRNSGNTSGTTMKYEIQDDLDAANNDTSVGGATLIDSGVIGDGKTGGLYVLYFTHHYDIGVQGL